MNNSERPCPATSSPTLEILCGETASPLRPLLQDRFLIGAGPRCDLRLGGDDMPLLHSIVYRDGDAIGIDPVADIPTLLVNGRPGITELHSGDTIEIGNFQMALHGADIVSQPTADAMPDDEETRDLADVFAAELIELIEQEEALIADYEGRRRAGAEALFDAAQRRADALADQSKSDASHEPGELLDGIRSTVLSLGQSAMQLEQHGSLTEHDVRQVAASLLDCQQQIISALDRVLEKIERQNKSQEPPMPQRDVA